MKQTLIPVILLGMLSACGKSDTAPASAPAPAPVVAAAPEAAPAQTEEQAKGERIYKGTCALCHSIGAAGAPILGNKAEWEPRIAQGKDVLYTHAINGFTGEKGVMPARGANTSLKDEDVKATVDYMVSKAK